MSYRGRGRGGGYNNNYHNSQGRNSSANYQQNVDSFAAANAYPIEIMGWNGASLTECINFISRKCKVTVSNYSVDKNTGVLRGYVRNESQANELVNWSGVKFAGQSLRFTKGPSALLDKMGGNSSTGSGSTIETITNFLKSRYQPELRMLNLSSVKQDPNLNNQGFFGSVSLTSKFFPALMKIALDLKLDVVSVDLSNNELSDLLSLSSMAQTFPRLQNLSLVNNRFSKIKVFETWRHKLNFLRELVLFNNPLVQTTNPTEIQSIKLELMKSFPRLVVLNGEVLRNEQILNVNTTFPFENPQTMFFQDDEVKTISTNFVTNYLNLWDSDRANLMVLYQGESQFSMQLDSSHPFLIDDSNSNASTDYGNYLSNSRNLARISSAKTRTDKVAKGPEAIYKQFQQLPKTKHDIANKPEEFSMECYKFAPLGGILITIHGSFEETAQPEVHGHQDSHSRGGNSNRYQSYNRPKKVALSKKNFDRTFLVFPGPNGSMIVASDLLLIRPYTSDSPWKQQPQQPQQPQQLQQAQQTQVQVPNPVHPSPVGAPQLNATPPIAGLSPQPVPSTNGGVNAGVGVGVGVGAGAPSATPTVNDLPAELKTRLQPLQQEVLVKIILETKLNLQYALMLCEQSAWNYEQSIVNFKNSAGSLPSDAFV